MDIILSKDNPRDKEEAMLKQLSAIAKDVIDNGIDNYRLPPLS